MKVSKLSPAPKMKVVFDYQKINSLPSEKGCYVLTSFEDEIIYLGLAVNLRRRLHEHFESDKNSHVSKYGKIFFIHYLVVSDEVDLGKTERGWLNLHELETGLLPPLNKVRSPVS